MASKVCPRCEMEKDYEEFYVNSRLKDGISTYCVPCTKLFLKESYEKRKAKKAAEQGSEVPKTSTRKKKVTKKATKKATHKVCESCEKRKELSDFFKTPTSPDGYNPFCKECLRSKKRKSRSEDVSSEPMWITEELL